MSKIVFQKNIVIEYFDPQWEFYQQRNLALGILEILNISFGNEQITNKTEMKLQTCIIFRKWKSLCWMVAVCKCKLSDH